MKTLCITMGPDWPLAEAEFKRVGLDVERFDAIVEDNRVLAFNKSVYACMKKCRTYKADDKSIDIGGGWRSISGDAFASVTEIHEDLLLFEDDVVFDARPYHGIVDKRMIIKDEVHGYNLAEIEKYPPQDFMTLHLGCNIIGTDTTVWQMPTKHEYSMAKLHNCWQSHATLYSAECVKYILDNFKYVTDEYKTEGCQIFDEWLRVNVLPMGRSYVLNPMICYQRPRKSAIWNVDSDYTGAHKQGNEWLKNNL